MSNSHIMTWANNIRGNITKLVNTFKNLYLAHMNLPGHLLQQEFFVRFVATSQHASTPEQFEAVLPGYQVKETNTNPPRTYNAHTHRMCRFHLVIPALPADNPQQSEEASHIGPSGNCKCRHSLIGGGTYVTESNEGCHPGPPWTVDNIKNKIHLQLEKAAEVNWDHTGVKDKVSQIWIMRIIQKTKEIKQANPSYTKDEVQAEAIKWLDSQPGDPWSPLLLEFSGLDPHRDTPVKILHMILLGIIKYVWHNLHTSLDEDMRALFWFVYPTNLHVGYMSQYPNGLIEKHFKTLMQTIIFHVHRLVKDLQTELIKAAGRLGVLVWYHEISDMDQYLVSYPQC
ncbi:hypothetical protein K439DRAFT_1646027 [Ramaria rubella]|nr:hypothetical protein K439DRAFT_1646027 [Ramaria rubella]